MNFSTDPGHTQWQRRDVLETLVSQHVSVPVDRINRQLPLNRLGLDALGLRHLAAAVDLELGVYVPPERIAQGLTLGKLVELV